jgi:ABC-type polysaccharide/polyol phosphate export permease
MFSEFGTSGSRPGGLGNFATRLGRRGARASLFAGIDHLFIIRSLILRELATRHQRVGKVGFLVEFIMPTVVILLHYYVFLALSRYMPAGIPVELFVLGGFPIWFTVRNTASKITRRGEGGTGVIFLPGISQVHFLLAGAIWECAAMIFMLYAGLAVAELLGCDEPIPNILVSMPLFAVAATIGTGARLVFEAISSIWPLFKGIKKVLLFATFLTSGIYYSGKSTSTQDLLTEISWYNPLIHLISYERRALWPGYPISQVSLAYPIEWAVGLMIVGLLMNRWLKPWTHK